MLRERFKSIIRPFAAKPWNSPVMEYRYGLWLGVSALFSESGRQLGEENTRPFLLNHHISAQTHACKYGGSREGRMINMSALRIAMQNFDDALNITKAVGQYHLARRAKIDEINGTADHKSAPGIWDLYLISRASIAIIAYQQRMRGGPVAPTLISDGLASQYQFISGIFMICRDMLNNGNGAIEANNHLTAQQLYDYADKEGIFISFNGMACAGSTKKIMEFLQYCLDINLNGKGAAGPDTAMHALIDNPENWYQYAISTVELDCFIEAEAQKRRANISPQNSRQYETSNAAYRAVAGYCQKVLIQNISNASDDFNGGILARQNAILNLLNRPPVSKLSGKHLAVRLGL